MNLLANAHWRAAPKIPGWLRRSAAALALIVAAAVAAQYLAGYFFLWSLHGEPKRATPLTILQYWIYYGHVPAIRRRATVCSGVGLGLVTALTHRAHPSETKAAARGSPVRPTRRDRTRGALQSRGAHHG